jgi:hypothetical protein
MTAFLVTDRVVEGTILKTRRFFMQFLNSFSIELYSTSGQKRKPPPGFPRFKKPG